MPASLTLSWIRSRSNVLKPAILATSLYWPGLRNRNRYKPASFEIVVRTTPVSVFVSCRLARATTAPEPSETIPLKLPRVSCAAARMQRPKKRPNICDCRFMIRSPLTSEDRCLRSRPDLSRARQQAVPSRYSRRRRVSGTPRIPHPSPFRQRAGRPLRTVRLQMPIHQIRVSSFPVRRRWPH